MTIEMPKGDYRPIKFKIKNKDGSDFNIDIQEIFITFKENYLIKDMLFQKRLSNGDIIKKEDGYYHFGIMPEDTQNLNCKDYVFDIEIYNKEPLIKQTILGVLKLTSEVTHIENEV